MIKSKYGKQPGKTSATSSDLFTLSTVGLSTSTKTAPTSIPSVKPLKTSNLSKNEKLVLAAAAQNEDQAQDAMIAL